MTIINNIEIDAIEFTEHRTKEAILNNDLIEDKLHVIIVISNPCLYATRYILAKQFIKRLEDYESHIILYIVELAYGDNKFYITDSKNPRHLQLRTTTAPLWHKENMINIGIRKLFPPTWRAVAWIDADIEFESTTWAQDTLKILNGYKDIVQLFSHAIDMDKKKYSMNIFSSFGFQYETGKSYINKGLDFWHPGFAWACTRKAYERMCGLYENSILGSGDHNMSFSLINNAIKSFNEKVSQAYRDDILEFQKRVRGLRLGYVPGIVRHYYHGSKLNRRYGDRWQILVKYQFNPLIHIKRNTDGLIIPTIECPSELLDDIMEYFRQRNEDE